MLMDNINTKHGHVLYPYHEDDVISSMHTYATEVVCCWRLAQYVRHSIQNLCKDPFRNCLCKGTQYNASLVRQAQIKAYNWFKVTNLTKLMLSIIHVLMQVRNKRDIMPGKFLTPQSNNLQLSDVMYALSMDSKLNKMCRRIKLGLQLYAKCFEQKSAKKTNMPKLCTIVAQWYGNLHVQIHRLQSNRSQWNHLKFHKITHLLGYLIGTKFQASIILH